MNNQIIGYHKFSHTEEILKEWTCEITGNVWPAGKYLIRNGNTWRRLKHPISSKGHRSFRYTEVTK